MIEFRNLSKRYGGKQVLKNVNLTIQPGEIFGLIGHNGAGKSTTIKSLVSIIEPTGGDIWVDGLRLEDHRFDIKKSMGYVPDSPNMFLRLTAAEYWNLIAVAYDIKEEQKRQQLRHLMDLFDMTEHQSEEISSFSHGMRQKTVIIGALLPEPKYWILDEPMTGLDPQASFDLKELMKEHAAKGNIVIFSTHVLEVAQQLCDHIAILKNGEILYDGTTSALIAQHENDSLEEIYLKLAGRSKGGEGDAVEAAR